MATREFAALWSRQARGLTIAEKAVLGVLAAFYDEQSGKARCTIGTLMWRFEASRIYIRQVIHALSKKGFIAIEETFNTRGLQETNRFRLNLQRTFPLGPGYDTGMRILRSVVRNITPDRTLADGFMEAWVRELPKRHSKRAKPKLYVAVSSAEHRSLIENEQYSLLRKLRDVPPALEFSEVVAVEMFISRKNRDQ